MEVAAIQELRTIIVHGVAMAPETYAGAGSFAAFCGIDERLQEASRLVVRRGLAADRIEPLSKLRGPNATVDDFHDSITTLDILAAIEHTATAAAESAPRYRFSPAEQDLIDVVREAGMSVSQSEILNVLAGKGKIPSEGTTKVTLATLKRHGFLADGPGGRGYVIP